MNHSFNLELQCTNVGFVWLGTDSTESDSSRGARNTPKRYHSFDVVGRWAVIHVDPSQDLVVLASRDGDMLWFLSIRTGEDHERIAGQRSGKLPSGQVNNTVAVDVSGEWALTQGVMENAEKRQYHLIHWPTNTRKVSASSCSHMQR